MDRIQFAEDGSGTHAYTLTYNPVEIDAPQTRRSDIIKSVISVDGESILFTPNFDSRRGKMMWRRYPIDGSTLGAAFTTMLGVLEDLVFPAVDGTPGDNGYHGTADGYTYIRFQDLSTAFDIYTTWTKIKVVALDRDVSSGGALIYDSVTLFWEEAE